MIRPIEESDLPALHALLTDRQVARWAGRTPYDALAVTRAAIGTPAVYRIGRFVGAELVAYGTLTRFPRDRMQHGARITLAWRDDPAEVLDAAIMTAERWLGVVRLEIEIDAEEPVRALLESRGFAVEVRKTAARRAHGALADELVFGRLRPGWVPDGPPTAPHAWAPRREALPVQIRHVQDTDLLDWAALHREPSVAWGTLQLPFSPTAAWESRIASNDHIGQHALVAVHEGRIVGSGGLHRHPFPADHSAIIGMAVHPDAQGRGVGGAILSTIVEIGRDWLGLGRIELNVYTDNVRAIALYEKFGFVREGARRANAYRDGAHVDSVAMALNTTRGTGGPVPTREIGDKR